MSKHTISDAARVVGKHRSTIQKHIREGKLSKLIDNDGNSYIETSELLRVYKNLVNPVGEGSRVADEIHHQTTGGSSLKIAELEARLEIEKLKREKAEALLHKTTESEAGWKEIADRLSLLLTDQRTKTERVSTTNIKYQKFMKKIVSK